MEMQRNIIEILTMAFMWVNGLLVGYVIWAPQSPFKQGFLDGASFRWLARLMRKK